MELKIRIKEGKEEWRQLTELETLLTELSRLNQVPESYKDKLKEQLKSRGITGYDISSERILGLFRTETIRDATQGEYGAWHTLQSLYVCSYNMPIQLCSQCANNLGPDGCYIVRTRGRAEGILKGKEVILSVNEE